MLHEGLMQYSCIISHKLSPLERRFRDIQIVIITNFVVVSSVGIKRVDCINQTNVHAPHTRTHRKKESVTKYL